MKCWMFCREDDHHEDRLLLAIFKKRLPFFREYGVEDENDPFDKIRAIDRWNELKLTFPNVLPADVMAFVNDNKQKDSSS